MYPEFAGNESPDSGSHGSINELPLRLKGERGGGGDDGILDL
jgi:hypothetical protein